MKQKIVFFAAALIIALYGNGYRISFYRVAQKAADLEVAPTTGQHEKSNKCLPNGYSIVKNGLGEYYWIDEGGYQGIFSENSLEDIVEAAWVWHDYRSDKVKRESFVRVKIE